MDKPLRILVVGLSWPPETFIERLLRGLPKQNFQITLATAQRPNDNWLTETGIQWMYAPIWRGASAGSLWHLIRHSISGFLCARKDAHLLQGFSSSGRNLHSRFTSWYMTAPFAGKRWDVIYFPWNGGAIAYLPLFNLGMPVVLSCRGSQINIAPHGPRQTDMLAGLRTTFEKAAAIHCVSQDILQTSERLGLDPAKAKIIYPAIDPDFFSPADKSQTKNTIFKIITAGSLIWVKGLEYALLAIQKLRDAKIPVQFDIIGDGAEHNRVLFTIKDLGLSSSVQLLGRLSPEQVRERLRQADVFLLSSLSEGVSNAALEAMSCGLPIVTTDCGGMREAVTDGVEGFVVPVRSPEKMADALKEIWQQPGLREKIGKAGRQRVIDQFTLKKQIDEFTRLFQEASK